MEQDEEFTVRDHRRADDGSTKEHAADKADPTTAPEQEHGNQQPLPDVDFATFVISLATSAQISMGAIPHPETNKTVTHLPSAKQMIDVLSMLQEKTRGNLTAEEASLIEQVLFNLRMHFVRVSEGEKRTGGS